MVDARVRRLAATLQPEWPAFLSLAVLWLGSLWAGTRLPARVPLHWDIHGQVNRWGSPWELVLGLPVLATAVYAGILLMDWGGLDFKAAREMSAATKRQIRLLVVLFLTGLHAVILRSVFKGGVLQGGLLVVCIGLFLALLGNLFPRLEPNAWAGIRVPPTLEDRDVWKATHRFAGRLFVGGGLLLLPMALLPDPWGLVAFPILAGGLFLASIIYAYRLRSLKG